MSILIFALYFLGSFYWSKQSICKMRCLKQNWGVFLWGNLDLELFISAGQKWVSVLCEKLKAFQTALSPPEHKYRDGVQFVAMLYPCVHWVTWLLLSPLLSMRSTGIHFHAALLGGYVCLYSIPSTHPMWTSASFPAPTSTPALLSWGRRCNVW